MKARDCEELATFPGGEQYLFSGTIGNMRKLSYLSGDPYAIVTKLSSGEKCPVTVTNVIACTMMYKGGVHVDDLDLYAEVDHFIDSVGIDDCVQFAYRLISHATLGSIKKKSQERQQMKARYLPSSLMPSWKAGLLLAALSITLIISACMIFK